MYKTAFNSGDQALLADDAGRVLGGGEWGPVESTSASVKQALADGHLVYVDTNNLPGKVRPEVTHAIDATTALNERVEAAKAADKTELLEAVQSAQPEEVMPEHPTKGDAVEAVMRRSDVDVPDASKTARGSSRSSQRG